jgi:DNA-binding GntR family transcriptional regulator
MVARLLAQLVQSGELPDEAFTGVRELLDSIEALTDGSSRELIGLGYSFHLSLASLTGNRMLQQFLEQVIGLLGRYRYLLWDQRKRRMDNVESHWRILQFIRDGDADAAEKAMRLHIASAKQAYIELIEGATPPERLE